MLTIFSSNYTKLTTFIFKIYDFENTGFISREDVRTILSYITIKSTNYCSNNLNLPSEKNSNSNNINNNINNSQINSSFNSNSTGSNFKFDKETFQDRLDSQEELHSLLDKCFKFEKKIDFTSFIFLIENIDSNIFIYLLIFLLEKRPFTNKTLENYKFISTVSEDENRKLHRLEDLNNFKLEEKSQICISPAYALRNSKSPNINMSNKFLASPTLLSKFLPTVSISRSPSFQRKNLSTDAYLISINGDPNNIIHSNTYNNTLQVNNTLTKYFLNSTDKNYKRNDNTTEESIRISNIPLCRTIKKSYQEMQENKNLFLQHLGLNNNSSTKSKGEESDISSNVSNSDQIEIEKNITEIIEGLNEVKIKLETENININENDKVKNNLTRFKNIEDKSIKCNAKEKVGDINNRLFNLENFKKTNTLNNLKKNLVNSNGSSNTTSPRGKKIDENQLYPSKKYKGDVNYINQKIFKASAINQKLTQEYY